MNARTRPVPNELSVKHAANGGFIVRHSYDNSSAGPSYMPQTEHAFTSHAQMMKHVREHTSAMNGGTDDGDADDAGATRGTGPKPKVTAQPNKGVTRPAGTKPAPTKAAGAAVAKRGRERGHGMD